jgi:serine protease Do
VTNRDSRDDRKLLAAPAVRVGLAALSAAVLIVGALVAPRATPTTIPVSEERAAPLIEEQVREVVRPFDGIADAATRVQIYGVAIERPPSTPPAGGTDFLAPRTDPPLPGAGVYVTERFVLTSLDALDELSNPRVIAADGTTLDTRAAAYDPSTGLVLLETASIGQVPPVAAAPPQVGTLVVAAAPHARGAGARPAFVSAVDGPNIAVEGLGPVARPGLPLFTLDGALLAIVVDRAGRTLPIQPMRDRLLARAAAGERLASIGVSWEPRREPLKGVADGVGLIVTSVVPRGPADVALLVAGDVVLALGDVELASGDDLRRALQTVGVGGEATVRVWRRGRSRDIRVTPQPALEVALLARDAGVAAVQESKP